MIRLHFLVEGATDDERPQRFWKPLRSRPMKDLRGFGNL